MVYRSLIACLLSIPAIAQTAGSPPAARPVPQPGAVPATRPAAPRIYNWSQNRLPFGTPVGATGQWLWARRPNQTWDVTRMDRPGTYRLLWRQVHFAKGLMAIDEHALTFDEWVAGLETLRAAYKAAGYDPSELKFILYDVPTTPFANVSEARNELYDAWLAKFDALAKHPLSKRMWAYCPSLYRTTPGQSIAEWNANVDRVLPVCRKAAAAMGLRLVPVISPVPAVPGDAANQGMATPEQMLAMLGRMRKEGLDCVVWINPALAGNEAIAYAIRAFEQGVTTAKE